MQLNISKFRLLILTLALGGCSFAPKYERPSMPIPTHYKEAGSWIKVTAPVKLKSQAWWRLYHDKTLNQLEENVFRNNKNLKTAWYRYQQVLDISDSIRSEKYPSLLGFGGATRQQNSQTAVNNSLPSSIFRYNIFILGSFLNYEIDAWGRVKNLVDAGDHEAKASQFDFASIRLSMHAELANHYFKLRGADALIRKLDKMVDTYQRTLYLTKQRYSGGIVPIAAVEEATVQLENVKTLTTDMRLIRSKLEHAIAVLTGKIPGNFSLPARHTLFKKVSISPSLTSALLLNRPDVAAAEERLMSANASIGVAKAAFFPQINFLGIGGFQTSRIAELFENKSLFWAVGPPTTLALITPQVTQVIFDGFKIEAQLRYAKSDYKKTLSQYKQTVLTAFQQVEDGLVSIHRLDQETQTQALSAQAANRALYQANERYKGGIATFLDVAPIEYQALQTEIALINTKTRRQISSVQLIRALGGAWPSTLKPTV